MILERKKIIYLVSICTLLIVGGVYFVEINVRDGDEIEVTKVKNGPPVYLIVFDEMSTEVLLDKDKVIDMKQFPNFKELALEANWYRNATSVSAETQFGVPAILTGRYPPLKDVRMKYENYPINVCTILWKAGYSINAYEPSTTLCNRAAGAKVSYQPRLLARINSYITKKLYSENQGRSQDFFDWVQESSSDANSLNVIHSLLPHFPYQYMSDGDKYTDRDYFYFKSSDVNDVWENEYLAGTAYQQYMWQSKHADLLLGKLIEKLKREGVYEKSVVIVTADHGVTFRKGANRRWPVLDDENNWVDKSAVMDLVKVPLLIKMPGKTEGRVIDKKVSSVDVLPTLINFLGVDVNIDFDGRDLMTEKAEEGLYTLLGRTHFNRDELKKRKHDLSILDEEYNSQKIKARHDIGRSWAVKTVWDDVIGRRIGGLTSFDVDISVDMSEAPMITGEIKGVEDKRALVLGIALNGKIEAVTYTYDKDEKRQYVGMLQDKVISSESDVEVIALDWVDEKND